MGQLISNVSVLYCDPRSVYRTLVVDWWDEARDARRYGGPNPIVAHPPCGPWGRLRHMSHGAGRDLAPLAVRQVRQWGGVLEHPFGSLLWKQCDLPRPGELPDAFGGRTIEVCQCDWGHVARKRTWLYLVGLTGSPLTWPPPHEPTHWISGGRNARRKGRGGLVPPGIKVCSAAQRRRTPAEFAVYLIALAAAAIHAPR